MISDCDVGNCDARIRSTGHLPPHQQLAEKPARVIPEAAKRLSGIHSPCRIDAETQGLWVPGSGPGTPQRSALWGPRSGRPRNDQTEFFSNLLES
jgi:hypothetical protein